MNRARREKMLLEALGPHRFFKPRSAQVYSAESVVVVNDRGGRAMIVKLKDGRLLSSASRFDSLWQWVRNNFWARSHHEALLRLGVLTEEQHQSLIDFDDQEMERSKRIAAARDMKRSLDVSGLKPTKAQEKYISEYL